MRSDPGLAMAGAGGDLRKRLAAAGAHRRRTAAGRRLTDPWRLPGAGLADRVADEPERHILAGGEQGLVAQRRHQEPVRSATDRGNGHASRRGGRSRSHRRRALHARRRDGVPLVPGRERCRRCGRDPSGRRVPRWADSGGRQRQPGSRIDPGLADGPRAHAPAASRAVRRLRPRARSAERHAARRLETARP